MWAAGRAKSPSVDWISAPCRSDSTMHTEAAVFYGPLTAPSLAGSCCRVHQHHWHPHSKGPEPLLAIRIICAPPVSGSDWALCLSKKVLASLCLNFNKSVQLKFMENFLIPLSCLQQHWMGKFLSSDSQGKSEWAISYLQCKKCKSCLLAQTPHWQTITGFIWRPVWIKYFAFLEKRWLCFVSVHQLYMYGLPHGGNCSMSTFNVVASALFLT